MGKEKTIATVISQEKISEGIFSLWISVPSISEFAKAGQFVSVFTKDASKLLPRPISICEIDKEKKAIRLVYRILGFGTKEFSTYKAGDSLWIEGPLGNGFPLSSKNAILIGGGIGIPPMLELSKQLAGAKNVVLGYRNNDLFMKDEFEKYAKVAIATDDGSCGTKGTVIDALVNNGIEGSVIYACGPTPMLKAIKAYAEKNNIECWISLEERMACGIGACLGCTCKSASIDDHSKVFNKRVCKDGPVFNSVDVLL